MIRERLITGTLSNGAGKAIAIGAWIFLTPVVLAKLGAEAYALWVLVGAIASYGMLLEGGFGGAVVKYVAEHVARDDRSAARSLVVSATWLYAGLAIVAVLLSVALAPLLPSLIKIEPALYGTAKWLIVLTGINIACAITFTPATAALRGLHRYDLHNAVIAVNAVTEASLVTAVLLSGGGVLSMMFALISANLVSGFTSMALLARVAPDLRLGLRGGSRASLRRVVLFSTGLFPIEAGRRLLSRADGFVIAAVDALSGVTPFALARRLAELSELAAVQFLRVIMPVASELHASNDIAKLRHLYLVSSRVGLAIAAPITATLIVLGPAVLTFWVGSEYAAYSHLLTLLALATLLGVCQWPAAEILLGMARHKVVAITSCATGVAHILLSIVLLPWLGLTGVAISALFTAAVGTLCVVVPFANRNLGVSMATMARQVWAPPAVAGSLATLVLWISRGHETAGNIVGFVSGVAAAMAVYGMAYLAMPAAAPERRLVVEFAAGPRRRQLLRHLPRFRRQTVPVGAPPAEPPQREPADLPAAQA